MNLLNFYVILRGLLVFTALVKHVTKEKTDSIYRTMTQGVLLYGVGGRNELFEEELWRLRLETVAIEKVRRRMEIDRRVTEKI